MSVELTAPPEAKGPAVAKLTKAQKLAALLVMLGPESASQILKSLDPHELEPVCAEMAKTTFLGQELQAAILQEFSDVAVQASSSIRGGVELTRTALERALGLFKASEIIGRVAPVHAPMDTLHGISDLEARQIYSILRQEHAQTIALILSYVGPEKAAETLVCFPAEQRDAILERIATLAPTPVEVVEQVVGVLVGRRGANPTRGLNQTGGVKTAAEMLNAMDKHLGTTVLTSLEERNPDLGVAIRQKMFTFADLAHLDATIMQRVLREVDLRELALALKKADERLQTALLGCISKRAAETVLEEMTFMGPARLREIEAAQLRILDRVRQMESEGDFDLRDTLRNESYEMV